MQIQLRQLAKRAASLGITLKVTPPAEAWLAARGYDPDFGARPLRRVLQREVGDHLAMLLLQGDFESGDTITVDVERGQAHLPLRPGRRRPARPRAAGIRSS